VRVRRTYSGTQADALPGKNDRKYSTISLGLADLRIYVFDKPTAEKVID
jgi:hypothetical protein